MRLILIAVILAAAAAFTLTARTTTAADVAEPMHGVAALRQQREPVDDNDDTRVEVQLVMVGIAVGVVVVLGSGAYLLRKKLGLVAGPPEQVDHH